MKKSDLAKFQSTLTQLRERLMRDVKMVEEALLQDADQPAELSHLPTHPADRASEGVDEEIAIAQNEEQILDDVEGALERIDAGTFGKCADCGSQIAEERLEAIPYTPYCIDCARKHSDDSEARG